jgi:hypothetical protein
LVGYSEYSGDVALEITYGISVGEPRPTNAAVGFVHCHIYVSNLLAKSTTRLDIIRTIQHNGEHTGFPPLYLDPVLQILNDVGQDNAYR